MPRLRQEQREQAIGRLNAGQRPLLVAQEINCNVYSTNDRVRSRRPRVAMTCQDKYIFRQHMNNRFTSDTQTYNCQPPETN